jgi:hypothetical protein
MKPINGKLGLNFGCQKREEKIANDFAHANYNTTEIVSVNNFCPQLRALLALCLRHFFFSVGKCRVRKRAAACRLSSIAFNLDHVADRFRCHHGNSMTDKGLHGSLIAAAG